MPQRLPRFRREALAESAGPAELAERLLNPFFEGSLLAEALPEICHDAFACPLPLTELSPGPNGARLQLLELFHGPTAAFKDYGARFLAACLERVLAEEPASSPPLTILVATSGDTGAAVASAFSGRDKTRVVVLFPKGRISPRQEHHLGCWDDNVLSIAVSGAFDDCQRLVKRAFSSARLRGKVRLGSANSINLGRLLPQSAYHAWGAMNAPQGTNFVVPTGNLGNAFACLLAREMGCFVLIPPPGWMPATSTSRCPTRLPATGSWPPPPTPPSSNRWLNRWSAQRSHRPRSWLNCSHAPPATQKSVPIWRPLPPTSSGASVLSRK